MRVAALYDIHGSLPALEAVLEEVRLAAVDRIVIGGDIVYRPMSREVLKCLFDLDIPMDVIQGNPEVSLGHGLSGREVRLSSAKFLKPVGLVKLEAQCYQSDVEDYS